MIDVNTMVTFDIKKKEPNEWKLESGAPVYYRVIAFMNKDKNWNIVVERRLIGADWFGTVTRFDPSVEFDTLEVIDKFVHSIPDDLSLSDVEQYLITGKVE